MRFMLLLMLVGMAHGALANPLRVCVGDVNVWPPFTYWQGSSAQEKAESLTGSATTLVLEALKKTRDRIPTAFHAMGSGSARIGASDRSL